jgi:hypothetical protein
MVEPLLPLIASNSLAQMLANNRGGVFHASGKIVTSGPVTHADISDEDRM